MTAEDVQPSVGGMAGAGTGTEESVPRVSSVPPLDLDAIEARADAATEGPWEIYRYRNGGGRIHLNGDDGRKRTLIADMDSAMDSIATAYNEGDREFLFAARTDVPALIAEVRRLRSVPPGSLAEAMLREAADFRTAVEDLAGEYTALGDALIFASGVASRLFDVLNPK